MAISLLCTGVELDLGSTKYNELAIKIDTIANDMKALQKAIINRLGVFATEFITWLTSFEASFAAPKTEMNQLKTKLMNNVNAMAKVAADLDALKTMTAYRPAVGQPTQLNKMGSSVMSGAYVSPSPPTISDIAAELKHHEAKNCMLSCLVFQLRTMSMIRNLLATWVYTELGLST